MGENSPGCCGDEGRRLFLAECETRKICAAGHNLEVSVFSCNHARF